MPTITTTTTIDLPAGKALAFAVSAGVGEAVADPDGRGARFVLGPQPVYIGPWSTAVRVDVRVSSGELVYQVDDDGQQGVDVSGALTLTPSGLTKGGVALTSSERGAVRGASDIYDAVDTDGTIPVMARHKTPITYRENGATVVASGKYLTSGAGTGQRAWYGEFHAGERITRIGAEFKFTAGAGGKNGVLALIPWAASVTASADIPPTPLHFTLSRTGWTVGILETTNGTIVNIGAGSYPELSADTRYIGEAVIDGDTAYLCLPDGSVAKVTDSALEGISGEYAGFEFYQLDGSVDDRVQIGRVWAGVGDQGVVGAATFWAASRANARIPAAKTITSVSDSAIPTTEALIDPSAIANVPKGNENKNVLCRLSAWLDVTAGHSVIYAPKFIDSLGATVSQPYLFSVTAPAGGFSGYATVEFVQPVDSDFSVNCEFRYLSTGGGDTVSAAANKPITMTFTPLG